MEEDDRICKFLLQEVDPKSPLNKKSIISVRMLYPRKWSAETDLFRYLKLEQLDLLRQEEAYFLFDASWEGYSPLKKSEQDDFPIFDILYFNCKKYNITPSQIIYASSNLQDEENIKKYCNENNKSPINTISFLRFEFFTDTLKFNNKIEHSILQTNIFYTDKYFASLNRKPRPARSLMQYSIVQNNLKKHALMSQQKFTMNNFPNFLFHASQSHDYKDSITQIRSWALQELPYVIERPDFDEDWCAFGPFENISHQTLFQLVNETLVEGENNSSLFYSEKTFKPIRCFQPFIIYGQSGANRYLKEIGYRTYEDWFDLSFDNEEDPHLRRCMILSVLKDTCQYLNSLSREQQIEWKFKNHETLIHNYNVFRNHVYSTQKFKKLVSDLESSLI